MQCNEAFGALVQSAMILIGAALGVLIAWLLIRREKRAAERALPTPAELAEMGRLRRECMENFWRASPSNVVDFERRER